jgi:RNase P/RNase MRP subunit POP5
MPKKAPGERWRYVAFTIDGAPIVARNDFLDSLMKASRGTSLQNSFRITVFGNNFGILKVPHTLKEEAIRVLSGMDRAGPAACSVRTLKTSGTIKTLKDKYKDRIGSSGFGE